MAEPAEKKPKLEENGSAGAGAEANGNANGERSFVRSPVLPPLPRRRRSPRSPRADSGLFPLPATLFGFARRFRREGGGGVVGF
jgi:hypothetical protein